MTDLISVVDQRIADKTTVQPLPPEPPQGGLVMDQSHHIISNIQEREVAPDRDPHPMLGMDASEYGKDFQRALEVSPEMRNYWVPPPEHKTENSMGQAIWESMKRDSFIGNIARWLDQVESEYGRNDEQQALIQEAAEELTWGISEEHHDHILSSPTMGLALRESARIRHREEQIRREHHQSIGKTLVADVAGFILDPSNLLPGMGMMKGVSVASRARHVSALATLSKSSKMQQMGALAAAGAFEEAIRMAPRYQSDPTFEANNYYEGIVMSAAFSGLLPAAFGGIKHGVVRGTQILPNVANDIQNHLHAWGVDVAVRQAMRFPGKLKDTGFRDPGTALRKSKEAAQDATAKKVHETNARNNTKEFDTVIKRDMQGDLPSSSGIVQSVEGVLDRAGDAALERVKVKLKRGAQATVATAVTSATLGPVPAVVVAGMFANRDYISIAMKAGVKAKNARRTAYNLAKSTGDKEAAAKILAETRATRGAPTTEQTLEAAQEMITNAVDTAKIRLRDIHAKASTC